MGSGKVRVKVTMSAELKAQLEAIAKSKGVPLSWLLLDAAIDTHINPKRARPTAKPTEPPPLPGASPKRQKASFDRSSEPVISTNEQVPLEALIKRFGGDKALKARLCQLGGRGGELFTGSIVHARKVEQVTMRLDPDGKPWMPTSPRRTEWVQMSADEFVKRVLG